MTNRKNDEYVNVCVRIKPNLNTDSSITSTAKCVELINNDEPILLVPERGQVYSFDRVFTESDTQKDIFDAIVKPLFDRVQGGYNCTVFTYGQTGTGKTYTMGTSCDVKAGLASPDDEGLIPRTLNAFLEAKEDYDVDIYISFMEIYNEKVFDLLTARDPIGPLVVKGFKVCGLSRKKVFSVCDANHFLRVGNKKRHTGETKQNLNSSRSHAIFTIYCVKRDSMSECVAKLNLVDLAGCESVRKTGTKGNSFYEGININKGLLSIGQVISALKSNSNYIPYRQSIITTILQDSLNKENYVSLIACVSSSVNDTHETVQTLEFSHRVKKIKNNPQVNRLLSQCDTPFKRFASTPLSHLRQSTAKKPKMIAALDPIREPIGGNSTAISENAKTFSLSESSISSETTSQFSPIIKRYMVGLESRLKNIIEETIQSVKGKSSVWLMEQNTPKIESPKFSLNDLQSTVSRLVQNEMQQLNTAITTRAASSPVNNDSNIKRVLSYDSPVLDDMKKDGEVNHIFKAPELLTKKPTRRSTRLSLKRASILSRNDNTFTEESFVKIKSPPPTLPTSTVVLRRSTRLSLKNNFKSSSNISMIDTTLVNERKLREESICGVNSMQIGNTTPHVTNINSFSEEFKSLPNKFNIQKPRKTPAVVKRKKKNNMNEESDPQTRLTIHNRNILNILNNGSQRELETLHSVGAKSAQQIILYRQLKGRFAKIEDLKAIPGWTNKKFDKFMSINFLS